MTPDLMDHLLAELNDTIDAAFNEEYKASDLKYGKNLLWVNMARLLLEKYLKTQKQELTNAAVGQPGYVVKLLEEKLEKQLEIKVQGKPIAIKLKGFADRIDFLGKNTWRIIDYKSGSVKPNELKIEDIADLREGFSNGYAFQLMMYGYLFFSKMENTQLGILSGIAPLKKSGQGFIPVKTPDNAEGVLCKSDFDQFELLLHDLLTDLFDPAKPFHQTDNVDNCRYCPFITTCGR
jgi:hypothetical protein